MKETKTGAKSFFSSKTWGEQKKWHSTRERDRAGEGKMAAWPSPCLKSTLVSHTCAQYREREASSAITKHYRTEKDSFWRIIHYWNIFFFATDVPDE